MYVGVMHACAWLDHVRALLPEVGSVGDLSASGASSSLVSGHSVHSIIFRANFPQALSSSLFSNLKSFEVFHMEKRGVVIRSLPEPPASVPSKHVRLTRGVRVREEDFE